MRRAVAILLGVVLASSSSQASALHVHAYTDHDHPEHHHGIAAHDHHRATPAHGEDDGEAHFESCDAGEHAVSITMGSAPPPQVHAIDVECGDSSVAEPRLSSSSVQQLTDVRVHGPPPIGHAPPRAPPLIFPA